MSETRSLAVANLLMDLENPRLTAGQHSQRDAVHAMLRAEGPKTLTLAEDIAARGQLNPADRIMVTPSPDDPKRFTVLEGNRRLTALRILAEPSLAEGTIEARDAKRLADWSKRFALKPVKEVDAVIFASREEAAPWIERRHTGERKGAGVVPWGNLERERFEARQKGISSPALQVLDFVVQKGEPDEAMHEKLANFSLTNLGRLVADNAVRDRLGIELKEGRLRTKHEEGAVLKALRKVVTDVAEGLKVADIYDAGARQRYLDRIKSSLPNPKKAGKESRVLVEESGGNGSAESTGARKRSGGSSSRERKGVAPTSCRLHIEATRIQKIYRELQTIAVENFPNAAGVLFRVFLELTVDHHIEKYGLLSGADYDKAPLAKKLTTVADDLEDREVMKKQALVPVRRAANDKRFLSSSIVTFHSYVHNKHTTPLASDLRTSWDDLQPFFENVWAE